MNRFDETFVNQVKTVFDNHEECYQAADWEKLQLKMGNRRNGFFVLLPYLAKAAVVILFLGLSIFVVNRYETDFNYLETASYLRIDTFKVINRQNISDIARNENHKNDKNSSKKYFNIKSSVNNNNKQVASGTAILINKNDDIAESRQSLLKKDHIEQLSSYENVKNIVLTTNKKAQDIKEMHIAKQEMEKPILQEIEDDEIEPQKQKRLGFGVSVASLSNYSDMGMEKGMGIGMGAGVSASYKLSKKLRLSTGMLLAKQTLDNFRYSGDNEVFAKKDKLSAESSNSYKISNVGVNDKKKVFITMDIPLNLVYQYKKFNFTSGFSSLFYIQEKEEFEYQQVVSNYIYNSKTKRYENTSNTTKIDKTSHITTNHFDFARLLNLSVGYAVHFKKSSLIFEPYVKIPLGTVSSQELLMGSGGLALRYNFFK